MNVICSGITPNTFFIGRRFFFVSVVSFLRCQWAAKRSFFNSDSSVARWSSLSFSIARWTKPPHGLESNLVINFLLTTDVVCKRVKYDFWTVGRFFVDAFFVFQTDSWTVILAKVVAPTFSLPHDE